MPGVGVEAKTTKGYQETSGGTGNVNYFDCGDGLMGVYLSKLIKLYT